MAAMLEERDRFLKLFDILFRDANDWIATTPKEKYDWVPVNNPNVRLGDRVGHLTIKSFYIHMAVTDHHWSRNIRDCAENRMIEIPRDEALTARLSNGDFVAESTRMHGENIEIIAAYTEEILRKKFRYATVERTGMEFLWNNYAHRAHHLGHMDMYLRQADVEPPAYYPF
jgi:uncharacterized damage-inducible protein DinB